MTLAGGRPVTALHICLVGALARTGGIALVIIALGAPGLRAERLPIQTYNTSNGLAHDRIRCIVPDSRGFLWFCTADGLSRFDGSRFVNYGPEQGLPNPSVEEIVEGGPGVYWVATLGGLARLRSGSTPSQDVNGVAPNASARPQDSATRSLTAYTLGSDAAVNTVFRLRKDRAGRLWIGTAGGLFVLEQPDGQPTFRRVDLNSATSPTRVRHVRALAEGADGSIWIGTPSGLFRRLPDGRVVGDPTVRAGEDVKSVLVDRFGRLWIGHDTGLSVAIPGPAGAAGKSPFIYAAPPVCGEGPNQIQLSDSPRRSVPIGHDRAMACPGTQPFRELRWPGVDRDVGRPDRVRRRAVSCVLDIARSCEPHD